MPDTTTEKFRFEELESDLLVAFLQDRILWIDLKDHIESVFFNSHEVSTFFRLLKMYFERYKDFPDKKVMATLMKKANVKREVFTLMDDVYTRGKLSHSKMKFIRDEAIEFIKNSKMERAILKGSELIGEKKYEEVRDIITEAVHWNPDVNLGTNYADAVKRYTILQELVGNVIESPWPTLNEFLGGGFFKKELYLFAAASSVGKSIALDQVALHAWDKLGLDVVVITLEMSEERKGQRMDACKFGINVQNVYNSRDTIINYFQNHQQKNKLFIKEMPQSTNVKKIEQYLYQLKLYEGIKPELIVVDYLDIMGPNQRRSGNEYIDQGYAGGDLRDLAKEMCIPIVSASQFNRNSINISIEELNEDKIADSWKKMMIADSLIAMGATADQRAGGIINMKGLKNRNGPKGYIIPMHIRYEVMQIIDPREIDAKRAKDIISSKKRRFGAPNISVDHDEDEIDITEEENDCGENINALDED